MSAGLQEVVALLLVAVIAGAFIFRRLRARRQRKQAREASVSADEIRRRR